MAHLSSESIYLTWITSLQFQKGSDMLSLVRDIDTAKDILCAV